MKKVKIFFRMKEKSDEHLVPAIKEAGYEVEEIDQLSKEHLPKIGKNLGTLIVDLDLLVDHFEEAEWIVLQLREETKCKVIIIAGGKSYRQMHDFKGWDGFIFKPFRVSEVVGNLERIGHNQQ